MTLGLIAAFGALIFWGFGDFLIQRTARLLGSVKALFLIGIVAFIGLFPFVLQDIAQLAIRDIVTLIILSVVVLGASLLNFEALRKGKIAIIEPIYGIELPITVVLSIVIGREMLASPQLLFMLLVFIGIVLSITEHHTHLRYHKRIFEKGVILAIISAGGMALTNFLVGESSREASPLVTIWFAHSSLALTCGIYLATTKKFRGMWKEIKKNPRTILGESFFDNIAWVCYAVATTTIPIAVVTTISESYIALAALLGLIFNKERLQTHQAIGIAFAIIGVILLSVVS